MYPPTDLLTLYPASAERGVEGFAKSGEGGEKAPWDFQIPPEFIDMRIPKRLSHVAEYEEWEDETQRLRPLTDGEKFELFPEMYLDSE